MNKELLKKLVDYNVISIIGLAKNVSKTTTLNYLIGKLEGIQLGLTSIGRDGEKYDVISQLPKPRIFIKKGTFVATARESYEASEVIMKTLKKTEYNTPLGEILILKALNDGLIELSGPSINKHLKNICLELKSLGCDLILIDGAFDRKSYATPIISDATILSTGASVSRDIENVVDLTSHIFDLLSVEKVKNERIRKISKDILLTAQVGIINDDYSFKLLKNSTALGSSKAILDQLTKKAKYLVIKGAITDNLIDEFGIKEIVKKITIITLDPTKLFLSRQSFYRFVKKGGNLKVLDRINIVAITINHTSPLGYEFDKDQFMRLLQERIDIPIFNLGPIENL